MTLHEFILAQMYFVSMRGYFIWFGFSLVLLISLTLFNKRKYLEVSCILFSLGSYIYSLVLKGIFQLPRPSTALLSSIKLDTYTFPSTHTVSYTVVFGFLLFLLFHLHIYDRLLSFSLKLILSYLILLVGVSRVFLGQHYIRDVVFGYIFGGIYLLGLIFLYKRLRNPVAENQKNKR